MRRHQVSLSFFTRPICRSFANIYDFSLAQMELSKLVAAFFRRFNGSVDSSMTEADMRMYDVFSASPAGGKLLLNLKVED